MIMKLKITTGSGQQKAKLDAIRKLYVNHDGDSNSEPTEVEVYNEDLLAKELHHQYRKHKNFLSVHYLIYYITKTTRTLQILLSCLRSRKRVINIF